MANSKDQPPVFREKKPSKRPLKRLDISKMSPLDAALYKNMQIRVDAAENILEKKFNQRVDAAVDAAKIESIKKVLLRGKATVEEIAEDFEVSIEFVKDVQMALNRI